MDKINRNNSTQGNNKQNWTKWVFGFIGVLILLFLIFMLFQTLFGKAYKCDNDKCNWVLFGNVSKNNCDTKCKKKCS